MIKLLMTLAILALGAQAGAQETVQQSASLGFACKRVDYQWDRLIPMELSVDGLTVKSIFFNKRGMASGPLKGKTFGTRSQVEVVNTSAFSKNVGFAVAVFDENDNLIGVASGGNKLGIVRPGKTATFDLGFSQVKERLQRGSYFIISLELVD
jgi:hypothetical protein